MNAKGKILTAAPVRGLTLVAVCAFAFWALDIGCLFRFAMGMPCPGCGMTRAWLALLRGDVAAAFAYHPMFWAVPLAFVLAWLQGELCLLGARPPRSLPGRMLAPITILEIVLVAALLAAWLVRLACPADAGLLFGGQPPAGVPADVIYIDAPEWITLLG